MTRAAVVLALALLTAPAAAHDWYTGKNSPENLPCCGGQDCHPLPKAAVREVKTGYAVDVTALPGLAVPPDAKEIIVPWDRVQPAPPDDEDFHACVWSGQLRCFFAPPMGT